MDQAWTRLKVWAEGPVGRIMLNRPAVMNALDLRTCVELEQALRELGERTRVILIQGAGANFCAGGDLADVLARKDDPVAMRELVDQINRAFFQAERSPVPVIAAVHGYALAGGCELMQACDLAIVAEDARIGDQHINFGLVPGGGGSQRLPRLIGKQRAKGLLLSGEWISGKQAAEWGLAYRAVPAAELESAALGLAERIGQKSRAGLRLIKELVEEGSRLALGDAVRLESDRFIAYIPSPDPHEGLTAFRDKRKPVFNQEEPT